MIALPVVTHETALGEQRSALVGMAITYAALKAQAEVEALERMSKE